MDANVAPQLPNSRMNLNLGFFSFFAFFFFLFCFFLFLVFIFQSCIISLVLTSVMDLWTTAVFCTEILVIEM